MMDEAVRGWRPYALLILLCLGLYLPGLAGLPVMDRDEARFAQATRQMLETHDFIAIRFQNEARNKKPAGIYWLQAASVSLFGNAKSNAIWPYRLPSLLGASTAALLTFGLGAGLVGRKPAFLGAALLAASLGVAVEAHLAKTDAVLLACVTAGQLALARLYRDAKEGRNAGWGIALSFWLAEAVGILIKGPVAPAVAALTILALVIADRDGRWLRALRPLAGLALVAMLVLPWLVAILRATQGTFLRQSLGTDFIGKLIGVQQSHGAPPLYYLLLLSVSFWPGALFLGPAIAWAWRQRCSIAGRFLIAWAVPFWIVVELVPTKLPNYILPAYPALALLVGSALSAAGESEHISWRWLDRLVAIMWFLATLGIVALLVVAPMNYGTGSVAGSIAAAIALYLGARLGLALWYKPAPHLGARAVILAILVLPLAFAFVAPSLDRLWLSRDAAALVAQAAPDNKAPISAVGYAEPSLVFMLGTKTMLASAPQAAAYIAGGHGALALVEQRDDSAFRHSIEARGWKPQELGEVAGLDYSNGRAMILRLYRGAPR